VAMTRARDRLLLVGSVSAKQFEARWKQDCEINTTALLHARSYADWLGIWFAKNCAATAGDGNCGETKDCRWILHDDASLVENTNETEAAKVKATVQLNSAETARLREKLETYYPFGAATDEPAKTSVSALRRRAMGMLEQEETNELFRPRTRARNTQVQSAMDKKSSADVGTAYHRFLERVAFDRLGDVKELRAEAERMVGEGILVREEVEWLNFESLLQFWRSDFGRKIQANARHAKRELPFTARFSPAELSREMTASATTGPAKELENEFVIVQGVADVAVILPKEIWLLDFKTDRVAANGLNDKMEIYRPQLNLYARALERIYGRPVTERWLHFLSCGKTVPLPGDPK
jgi:ATP-dependent helicase/nuclease subunit A